MLSKRFKHKVLQVTYRPGKNKDIPSRVLTALDEVDKAVEKVFPKSSDKDKKDKDDKKDEEKA